MRLNPKAERLAPPPRSGAVWMPNPVSFGEVDMTAATSALSYRLRPLLAAICLGAAGALSSAPAFARGPEGVADVAEKVIDAVVNISTSQTVEAKAGDGRGAVPQLPPG